MRMACGTLTGAKAHMESASKQRGLSLRGPAVDASMIHECPRFKTATLATGSKDARPLQWGMSTSTGCAKRERQSARTMTKASTELATKSLPASHVMAWECASWHACMKPAGHCEPAQHERCSASHLGYGAWARLGNSQKSPTF